MKAAIYCRLSEEDKNKQKETDDSISIKNQKTMLLKYALEQGWDIYGIYSDDDYAGSDRKRPEFNRLLEDAKNQKFDIILCKTQSRFTRELELVEKYIHGLFPVWGIRFVSVVDNADTANKGNKKSRQINGLVNEWYLEDMSDNIRSVLNSRRENGLHIGAFALYGYRKDPEQKGHLIIDEKAAAVVKEVFTLYAQGYGKTAIARMLNDRGVPNPTEYKRQQGLRYQQSRAKNSTLWKYFTIAHMLTNQIYLGNMVQGKYGSVSYKTKQNKPRPKSQWYIVENTHEPIVDSGLWERVQTRLAQSARPFETGTIGLFAGKVRCAGCGCLMCSSKNRGRHYLRCSNRRVAKEACIGAFISVDRLEQAVINEHMQLSEKYLDKDELEQSVTFCGDWQEEKQRLLSDTAAYEKRKVEYTKGIRELYMDKTKGILTEKDFVVLSEDFTAERERLEQAIRDGQRQIKELTKKIEAGGGHRKLVEEYTSLKRLDRETVEALIDYISIGRRITGTRDVPIEIHWNF